MQSQQKRVKWSRGETAEALEERTDTGITQASVELLVNCIPDIFGNLSLRPGLSVLPLSSSYNDGSATQYLGFTFDTGTQYAVFYITEDDIILIAIHTHAQPEFLRIKNGEVVSKKIATDTTCWNGVEENGVWIPKVISYAQQNNYLIIATISNTYKITFPTINDITFTPEIELWKFSAGWYATEGTHTRQVTNSTVPNLEFSGAFTNYIYTSPDGTSTVYSNTSTGVSFANLSLLQAMIPAGSIVQLPEIGCFFRIEGYNPGTDTAFVFQDVTVDNVLGINDPVPATGIYCRAETYPVHTQGSIFYGHNGCLVLYVDGVEVERYKGGTNGDVAYIKNSSSSTGVSEATLTITYSTVSPTNVVITGAYGSWSDATTGTVYAHGALLTPVSDKDATDSSVNIEYGYTSLQPETWAVTRNFPHPTKVIFNDQRLWGGGWAYSTTQQYALVIGSQIARYNDFKNDYNFENEPITLDILTQFKEKIIHLVDYNGLKVFTDAYEYAYVNGGLVKQSSNGAYENCPPLVFESLCLYVDSTGNQVKAMQYEFQNNIFNSSSINQVAPHDLVWFPFAMAAYEDKVYSTGKYLFLINKDETNIPRIAVCNFVPSNQANIWSRWATANVTLNDGLVYPLVDMVIHTKKFPIFMLNFYQQNSDNDTLPSIVYPAILDFESNIDVKTTPTGTTMAVISYTKSDVTYQLIMPSADVAVYANGEFKFMDTLTSAGKLTKSITELTNVTIGLPINAIIRSHPIDVGGKTKSIKKRIGKAQMSVHDTEPGAITINNKTGYMNPAKDHICFYGVTGMKEEIKYTITNNNGAAFHLESLLMNIEYGTLDS